jgi:ATP/maltotriose-dependent transcriptional regulator MalT
METFEYAVKVLERNPLDGERHLTLAALLPSVGWSAIRMGRLALARESFTRSLAIYDRVGADLPTVWGGDPLPGLGLVAAITGDYDHAIRIAGEAEQRCLARNDRQNLQIVYYVWQTAAYALGDYETAHHYAMLAYGLTQAAGNHWMTAYILRELGNIARASHDPVAARRYYTASYELKESLNDPEGMAATLIELARTAQLEESFDEARTLYRKSEAIYRKIYDQGGLANALHGLGQTALAGADLNKAADHLREALQIAASMSWKPLILSILVTIAELLQKGEESVRSLELIGQVTYHSSTEHQTRCRVQTLLDTYESIYPKTVIDGALVNGRKVGLEETTAALQLLLSTLHFDNNQPKAVSAPTQQPLIEPLTGRELEVLHHMAGGLTNQEIADTLIVAIGTVKSYTSQIYGKLGVRNRIEAVARAQEIALI